LSNRKLVFVTLTTTIGVFESSASHIVSIADRPPSTRTITIGISVCRAPSIVSPIFFRLENLSISARNGRTWSAFGVPSSNNKKCV